MGKKIQAIIPTAGVGARLKSKTLKSLIEIQGCPLFIHTLAAFEKSRSIKDVVLVVHPAHAKVFEKLLKKHKITKVKKIVSGGATRRESVFAGIQALDADTQIVLVHDGARALITPALIDRCVKEAQAQPALITGVKVKSTIKRIDTKTAIVEETLPRDQLVEVQTPQVFHRDVLVRAHKESKLKDPSDDAVMVEGLGIAVKVIEGDYQNIKVTTSEDVQIAKIFLAAR